MHSVSLQRMHVRFIDDVIHPKTVVGEVIQGLNVCLLEAHIILHRLEQQYARAAFQPHNDVTL